MLTVTSCRVPRAPEHWNGLSRVGRAGTPSLWSPPEQPSSSKDPATLGLARALLGVLGRGRLGLSGTFCIIKAWWESPELASVPEVGAGACGLRSGN